MRLTHGSRVFLYALGGAVPAVVVALFALDRAGVSGDGQITVVLVLLLTSLGFASAARALVERPLQTLANLLSALREEDYSFRARIGRRDDALGEVTTELNTLAELLKTQRLGALEATALLRAVMEEIDVAVFAIDEERKLRLTNRAGARLLGRSVERSLGLSMSDLGLDGALQLAEKGGGVLDALYAGKPGRFEVRGGVFRQGGRPHQLLVMSDVSRALREEEREAWRRLIRVMGHEINNSLAPIKSIAASLETALRRDPPPADLGEDLRTGLSIVGKRADALGRFTAGYAQLARLPAPRPVKIRVEDLVTRVGSMRAVAVVSGPDVAVAADPDQAEQALINLVKNALDAVAPRTDGVRLGWRELGPSPGALVEIVVDDDGPGLAPTANLFVPFFTTKTEGTGIGLALSRQIAEQNGGSVSLANRPEGGARAVLALPRAP